MRRWVRRLAVLVGVALVVLALRLTVLAPDPLEVDTVAVDRGRVEETITNSRAGSVTARRRAKLSPEIGGQVVAIPFREGDRVAAGDVLLRLDDRTQRANLELAETAQQAADAERRRACLAAERAAREFERVARLASEQIVSADLLDQVESNHSTADAACEAAAAQAAQARASVAVARTELAKTVVKAPFDGVVAEVSIEVGEWTTPSPPALPVPPVIDVLDPASIYVKAPMDEVDSARIRRGLPARVTVDSHRDRLLAGEVIRVAPYVLDIQEQNRTVEIEVELADREILGELLPGTSADVEIILTASEDVLRIPTAALIEGDKVLVLEQGRLAEREVETGLRNWDLTEVRSGLEEGESVVASLDRPEVKAGAEAVAADDGTAAAGGA